MACFAYFVDRLTKIAASRLLELDRPVSVIPNIFNLTLTSNTGAAFGLLKDHRILFLSLSVFVIIFILIYAMRHKSMPIATAAALGLVLGGAVGNMVDRIRLGYVIDFLDFRIWPVFNIADSSICIGAGMLILIAFLHKETVA